MLTEEMPAIPLDRRRLSEFSPKPENSHGARNTDRTAFKQWRQKGASFPVPHRHGVLTNAR